MVRDSQWKLIHYPAIDRWQLFDLAADPHELTDLSEETAQAEVFMRLRETLLREQVAADDPVATD